ncbi:MAG: TetR family transcriptional regulator [Frankiales bacterium]|nr:TetR family transcriptional regulator [Frankiales bacterium]
MGTVKQGRPAVTTREELELIALQLFAERGFDRTTVDDVAEAAGIGRRTFFRYFASKNDVGWGDWELALAHFRTQLAALPSDAPLMAGLKEAVKAFNLLPDGAEAQHRVRMAMVLHTPALQAHSTLRYAGWREVVAQHVASRTGRHAGDFRCQLLAHQVLACCVAAYEQWLTDPEADLQGLLDEAVSTLG